MKTRVKYLLYLIVALFLVSCKKQKTETPIKETYPQYFRANIAGKSLDIKSSIDLNRKIFSGSWTILGYSDEKKEKYIE